MGGEGERWGRGRRLGGEEWGGGGEAKETRRGGEGRRTGGRKRGSVGGGGEGRRVDESGDVNRDVGTGQVTGPEVDGAPGRDVVKW